MFSDFIYYIVVLLIYNSYIPPGIGSFSSTESVSIALLLFLLFYLGCRVFIGKKNNTIKDPYVLERRLDRRVNVFAVIAVLLFTVYVYILDLPELFSNFFPFERMPSLQAVFFMGIFILFRIVIWNYTYDFQKSQAPLHIGKKTYIGSYVSFSLPALMPWFTLSILSDFISMLPFGTVRAFFDSTVGELLYLFSLIFLISLAGPILIKKFWRCRPLESGPSRSRIEEICSKAGVAYKDILKWELFGGTMITAGVMGVVRKFRYILVTPALLQQLTQDEIDLVITHEIGHVKKHHLLFYMFFFISYIGVLYALLTPVLLLIFYSGPVTWITDVSALDRDFVASVMLGIMMILSFILFFRFVFGFYMRNFERQADTFVYSMFGTALPLISTFHKIAGRGKRSADKPNWHHFSIKDRIDYLNKCENDRFWVKKHDDKIKKMICSYILGILIVGFIGFNLNFGKYADRIKRHVSEKIFMDKLSDLTDKKTAMTVTGDYYLNKENYAGAERAYIKAIKENPANAHCLNNLAWIYATCEDNRFRKPTVALRLALKAVQIENTPNILDTLAMAYFANGLYDLAVTTERKALNLAVNKSHIYEKQLIKFQNAANRSKDDNPIQ